VLKGLRAVRRFERFESIVHQRRAQEEAPHRRLILDDQDPSGGFMRRGSSGTSSGETALNGGSERESPHR